jgi:hypothetical protein
MTSRRKNLLIVLPLLILALFVGLVGPVELTIWLIAVAAWLYAFFGWGRKEAPGDKGLKGA